MSKKTERELIEALKDLAAAIRESKQPYYVYPQPVTIPYHPWWEWTITTSGTSTNASTDSMTINSDGYVFNAHD
jgi:hypothetical protein